MNSTWIDFLTTQGAVISERSIQHFGAPNDELKAAKTQTVIADLSHFSIIAAKGDDSETFLQGQITNSIKKLTGNNWQLNGYCTPKGRLLASFLIWKQQDRYQIQIHHTLRESIQKRLTMFVLRSKVKITDSSEETIRIGIAGPLARQLIETTLGSSSPQPKQIATCTQGIILGLGENRFELSLAPEHAQDIWQTLKQQAMPVGSDTWNWLSVQAAEPIVYKQTQEEFVPQMVNFDLVDGVDFKKGCYTGQEIVARTQYLGKLKKRMYLGNVTTSNNVNPGDHLFSADFDGQASGMVVNAAPAPDGGVDILAVIQISSAANETIHLHSPDGPALRLTELPYTLA